MNARGDFARRTAAAAVAVSMLASLSDAQAFRMIQNGSTGRVSAGALVTCNDPGGFVHWTNNSSINWFHNTAGQGSDKAAALQPALLSWTNVPNASHVLTYAGATSAGFATDGLNTLLWATGNGCTGNCLALTALVLQAGQVIVESDITFNAAFNWTTNGANFDTQTVAAHELGHSLGIHHTEVATAPSPTMNAFYFGPDGRSLESDDHAALQCAQNRYPLPGTGTPAAPIPPWVNGSVLSFCAGQFNSIRRVFNFTISGGSQTVTISPSNSFYTVTTTGWTSGTTLGPGTYSTTIAGTFNPSGFSPITITFAEAGLSSTATVHTFERLTCPF